MSLSPPPQPPPALADPLLPPPQQPPPSSRRFPPPCWTPDETSALIDAYREKWYSLRRSNLRASHWEEVADGVHRVCPDVLPPKTAVQCRHKMEKLRKRYRVEVQRAKSIPHHRFNSSWIYYAKMHSMEKGVDNNVVVSSSPANNVVSSSPANNVVVNGDLVNVNGGFDVDFDNYNDIDEEDVDDEDLDNRTSFRTDFQRNGLKIRSEGSSMKTYGGFDQIRNPNPNPRFGRYNEFARPAPTPPQFEEGERFASRVLKNGGGFGGVGSGGSSGGGSYLAMGMPKKKRSALGKRVREEERGKGRDGLAAMEMVEDIRVMGEGFMRMEKMKMDMVREWERESMECELKRTQMFLESQRQIVEAFTKGWCEVVVNKDDEEDHEHGNDKSNENGES